MASRDCSLWLLHDAVSGGLNCDFIDAPVITTHRVCFLDIEELAFLVILELRRFSKNRNLDTEVLLLK